MNSLFRGIRRWLGMMLLIVGLSGCETFQLGGAEATGEVPKEGLLGAKLTALAYGMDQLPDEDRRYLEDGYAAYGIMDADEIHQKALVRFLEGRTPPVVDEDALYSRSSNSQWFDGKPALKWTASAEKVPEQPRLAEVVVGWMHSQHINRFTTYVLEWDGERWSVVDVKLLEEAVAAAGSSS